MSTPPVEIHDLTISYHKRPVLWGVDIDIPEKALVGIIGPNGAGKSTLIKGIMGMLPLSSGYVKIFGEPLKKRRRDLAYVPQREAIDWDFPVTAYDVALMGRYGHLGLLQRPSREDKRLAEEALEKVGMQSYRDRQIGNLSGGQQQRVFLARALAQQAQIYLMDEPFVGVDAATEHIIIDLLKELKNQGKTLVVVNHDLQAAKEYFDYLLLLNMRKVAFGPTEEVFTNELLQKTYGGKLTILSDAAEATREHEGVPKH